MLVTSNPGPARRFTVPGRPGPEPPARRQQVTVIAAGGRGRQPDSELAASPTRSREALPQGLESSVKALPLGFKPAVTRVTVARLPGSRIRLKTAHWHSGSESGFQHRISVRVTCTERVTGVRARVISVAAGTPRSRLGAGGGQ